ncbi:MAG: hypothetical protein K1X53_10360 [Candidatus Sumerlaeaceae bacterium]|nr:hypothetical protein [Candidatus Sumerlaeaceae bacterium]
MALQAREMKILWLTVALSGAALLWMYGISPLYDGYTELAEKLDREAARYKSNIEIVGREKAIEEAYQKVEATFPSEVEGKVPEDSFIEDVDTAASTILPASRRTGGMSVKAEEIKDVNGYEFLVLNFGTTGELPGIATLLKSFDAKGFLVKSITLAQNRGVDNPELKLDMTLARIVKLEEEGDAPAGPGRKLRKPQGGGSAK